MKSPPPQGLVIREIRPTDAEAAAELSAELGYVVTPEVMKDRITRISSSDSNMTYVAASADRVIGWIDLCIVQHLASGRYLEIGGFVVAETHRNRGIGGELVRAAERWGQEQGVTKAVVRSRVTRQDTHRFYLRAGYAITKTSTVFSKELKSN